MHVTPGGATLHNVGTALAERVLVLVAESGDPTVAFVDLIDLIDQRRADPLPVAAFADTPAGTGEPAHGCFASAAGRHGTTGRSRDIRSCASDGYRCGRSS